MPRQHDLAVLEIFRRVRFALVCRTDLEPFYALLLTMNKCVRIDCCDHARGGPVIDMLQAK
jgi:hypothetical protein